MSEERSNEINAEATESIKEKSAFRISELEILSDSIKKSGKSAEERKNASEVGRIADEEREARIAKAKALMEENTARARKEADARLARMEYGGEYRQRLAATENKKAAEEAARRMRDAENERRALEEERARAIEEFRRREEEEAQRRAFDTEKLFSDLDTKKFDPEPQEAREPQRAEAVSERNELSEISADDLFRSDNISQEEQTDPAENEKITLDINPQKRYREPAVKATDDGRLHMTGATVAAGGAMHYLVNNGLQDKPIFKTEPALHTKESVDPSVVEDKLRSAELSYQNYKEELRMLDEQRMTYNNEAKRIRAERMMREEYREAQYSENIEPLYPDPDYAAPRYPDVDYTALRYADNDRAAPKYTDMGYNVPKYTDDLGYTALGSAAALANDEYREVPIDYQRNEEYTRIAELDMEKGEPELQSYEESLYRDEIDFPDAISSELAASEYMEQVDDMPDAQADEIENGGYISFYAKSALPKSLNKYHKQKALLEKKLRKTAKQQGTATIQKNAVLIVAKIGIQKEIIELTIDSVMACIYAKSRSATEKQRGVLEKCVLQYNAFCDEYEMLVGKPLPKLSETMADDVAAGRVTDPIPNIYYPADSKALLDDSVEKNDLRLAEEANRSYGETYTEEKEIEAIIAEDGLYLESEEAARRRGRERDAKALSVKKAIERDILLIGLRNEYNLMGYESERDMIANSFGNDSVKQQHKIREYDKIISRERGHLKKAIKLERDDNARYYMLMMDNGTAVKTKKRARADKLGALKLRLEVLLSEREELNEKLISLYGGSSKKVPSGKINRKAKAVRKRKARAAYKKHKRLAAAIGGMKVSVDMKAKGYSLINKKIECEATIAENTYKLRKLKPMGAARRELISDIKRSKAMIKQAESDLKFIMKKMKKRERKAIADRNWVILWIAILLLVAGGVLCWYFFGDAIRAALAELFKGK